MPIVVERGSRAGVLGPGAGARADVHHEVLGHRVHRARAVDGEAGRVALAEVAARATTPRRDLRSTEARPRRGAHSDPQAPGVVVPRDGGVPVHANGSDEVARAAGSDRLRGHPRLVDADGSAGAASPAGVDRGGPDERDDGDLTVRRDVRKPAALATNYPSAQRRRGMTRGGNRDQRGRGKRDGESAPPTNRELIHLPDSIQRATRRQLARRPAPTGLVVGRDGVVRNRGRCLDRDSSAANQETDMARGGHDGGHAGQRF